MLSIKLIKMREQVKKEVEHIPKGDLYQNLLRQSYATFRMASLGKKGKYPNDKNEILRLAIQNMEEYTKKEGMAFTPNYDRRFFDYAKIFMH
jgi:hypothetical protein